MRQVLCQILESVVCGVELNEKWVRGLREEDWLELYFGAKQQGIAAVVFEKIKTLPKDVAPPKALAVRWMSHSLNIAKKAKEKMEKSASWAELMAQKGMQTLVLKGGAFSAYYPNPYHREFGDLDCYLFKLKENELCWDGCFEQGNRHSQDCGFQIETSFYKHSEINYYGLDIENHQFALPVKDGPEMKALERELRRLVSRSEQVHRMGYTHLYMPSADFNALLLIAHAMSHFLYEGLRLRHVLDWALLLKKEQENIDWDNFWMWCDKMKYSKFVRCLNYICEHQLGMDLPSCVNQHRLVESHLPKKILDDMFEEDSLYSKGYKGLHFRMMLVGRYFKNLWKFHEVHERNAFYLLARRMKNYWVKDVKL